MAPQADFGKIGYEIEKFFGRQKSFGNSNSAAATQNLCQYKFYPATKVVHMHVDDVVKCNEAASRYIPELQMNKAAREIIAWFGGGTGRARI
ncbi:hypothetical protein RJT34_14667 [Clitoria ternatea]|uniref:Uncharacterized protein n=1 Tax=Clitoria ternatea TaxID=43366 RepID=A0AAN9PN44_CLITE